MKDWTEVKVAKIVDGGTFWVTSLSSDNDCEFRSFDEFDERFNEIYSRIENASFVPHTNQVVAVLKVKHNHWFRGRILRVSNSGHIFRLLLLDYGWIKECTKDQCQLLPLKCPFSLDIYPPRAHLILLHGLRPAKPVINYVKPVCPSIAENWLLAQEKLLKKLLTGGSNRVQVKISLVFSLILDKKGNELEVKFGRIRFCTHEENECHWQMLEKILIRQQYVLSVDTDLFEAEDVPKLLTKELDRHCTKPCKDEVLDSNNPRKFGSKSGVSDDVTDLPKESNAVVDVPSRSEINVKMEEDGIMYNYECSETNGAASEMEAKLLSERVDKSNELKAAQEDWLERSESAIIGRILVLFKETKFFNCRQKSTFTTRSQLPFKPALRLNDIPLHPHTLKKLEEYGVRDLTRCQRHAVSAMLTGESTLLVDVPHSGKTIAYLIAFASILLQAPQDKPHLKVSSYGVSPLLLIVCPSASVCQWVRKLADRLFHHRFVIKHIYAGLDDLDHRMELLNGSDVLISSIHSLLKILTSNLYNLRRVCYVVFDQAHLLSKMCKFEQVMEIVEGISSSVAAQKVVVSDWWNPPVRNFFAPVLAHSETYIILIADYLEAALYAKFFPTFHSVSHFSVLQKLVEEYLIRVKEEKKCCKIVLVCKDSEEAENLHAVIKSNAVCLISDVKGNIRDRVNKWRRAGDVGVSTLVCTDFSLDDLKIYDADVLLHYTLPTSENLFRLRFKCLLDHYIRALLHQQEEKCQVNADIKIIDGEEKEKRRAEYVIYMTKEDDKQLGGILRLLSERFGYQLPLVQSMELQELERKRELRKIEAGIELCDSLKTFGKCRRQRGRCRQRHFMSPVIDQPAIQFQPDTLLKMEIVSVNSASEFSVRLTEYKNNADRVWMPFSSKAQTNPFVIHVKLKKYFSNPSNIRQFEQSASRRKNSAEKEDDDTASDDCLRGEWAAVREEESYRRVRLGRVVKWNRIPMTRGTDQDGDLELVMKQVPSSVQVLFIDHGITAVVQMCELLELPDDLKQLLSPALFHVFLCNLDPPDEDVCWNDSSYQFVHNLIHSVNQQSHQDTHSNVIFPHFYIAKVKLIVDRNIWMDGLECQRWSQTFNRYVTLFSVRKELLDAKLAIPADHLNNLCRLWNDAISSGNLK